MRCVPLGPPARRWGPATKRIQSVSISSASICIDVARRIFPTKEAPRPLLTIRGSVHEWNFPLLRFVCRRISTVVCLRIGTQFAKTRFGFDMYLIGPHNTKCGVVDCGATEARGGRVLEIGAVILAVWDAL